MSVALLDRTRRLWRLLAEADSGRLFFGDVCRVLSETMSSRALVLSKKGKLLGMCACDGAGSMHGFLPDEVGQVADWEFNERLLSILSTKENLNLETLGFSESDARTYYGVVTPTAVGGERLGTIFLYRRDSEYGIDDIILCEYAAAVVSLEMLRAVNEENAEEDMLRREAESAVRTLSPSEREAMFDVFGEISGEEGLLVASRVADQVGVARSVIVSALRKFESAGIIETRSSGMKGTYIRILNRLAMGEMERSVGSEESV